MKRHMTAALASILLMGGLAIAGPTASGEDEVPAVEQTPAVAVPVIVEAGPKPHNRHDWDRRRSCKWHSRVEVRYQEVLWNPATRYAEGVIFEYWSPQFWSTDWTRVVPSPRGCVLRHREWMRHHRGARR